MCLTYVMLASPTVRRGICKTLLRATTLTKPFHEQRSLLIRVARTYSSRTQPAKWSTSRSILLSFSFPALFKKTARLTRDDIASVDHADIPKEVYFDDLLAKAKQRQSRIKLFINWLWSFTRMILRSWRLILTLTPFVCTYPLTYVSKSFYEIWLRALLFATERSGPTLVKFGQWASTRRDLFSKEFCDKFSKLHRRTRPHSWYYTKKKLEKAFGKRWRDVLVRIDDKDKPLGSGCVAQVYKAYMPSEMVVDDDVLEEILADIDDHKDVDDLDSFEILGFSSFFQRWAPTDHEHEKQDERPTLSFAKSKQLVPALSSRSEKDRRDEEKRAVKEAREAGSRDRILNWEVPEEEEETMTDMEVAVHDGLVPVAVKVLHPGIYRAVQRDLMILRSLAAVCEFLFSKLRWLSVKDCVEEFADIMEAQIDLRHEAKCLEKFYDNFENVPSVRFPRPVRPFVKRNVLVETFEEGDSISEFLHKDETKDNGNGSVDQVPVDKAVEIAQKLADIGADALLQMIFVDNFIHGDLHPGNILVQNARDYMSQEHDSKLTLVDICDTTVVNVKPVDSSLRLVLLDVGIASSMSEAHKGAFHSVFKAVVLGEGEKVGDLLLDHASHHQCRDRKTFVKEIAAVVSDAREKTVRLGKIQVGDLLSNVFSILIRHKVKLESNFLSVILAIMVLEGLGRSLDPEMDILEKAKPVLLNAI